MLPEDREFLTSDLSYKPEDVNLTGVFSLGYFISEQIFNLNGKSKFRTIDSPEEKEKIAYFFKDKVKYPQDLETYRLQCLNIRFVDDDELRKDVVPDRTIYLVDGVEIDFKNLKSKDLVIDMGLDWNAIIILRRGIMKSFDSLSKVIDIRPVPECSWLCLLGSFIYEETFEDLVDDNIFTDGIWIENLIYSCALYILNGYKYDPKKLMKFTTNLFLCISSAHFEFCHSTEDIVKIMTDPEIQKLAFINQLDLAERLIDIRKKDTTKPRKEFDLAFAKEELKKMDINL